MNQSKVYLCREITSEAVLKLYDAVAHELPGKVAVKLHSGEVGNQNFIKPAFWQPVIEKVNGTIVECNTAYAGERNNSKNHWKTMKMHGWTDIAEVDIMDEEGEFEIPVKNGTYIQKNFVGSHMKNYDSMLVLSHFKGHPMGGFGGALKNISIGVASSHGKEYIHGAGIPANMWTAEQNAFLDAMADAASSVVDYFKGNMVFINAMCNLSVDCDCCSVAEDPCMKDIGILASLDPIALDQACIDLIYQSKDRGRDHFVERVESKNGIEILNAVERLGFGNREYQIEEL